MSGGANTREPNEFGLAAIFDNIRDGLILVQFPQRVVVMFNRAAEEMSGLSADTVLESSPDALFADPAVLETMRICSELPVGSWPGHYQEVLKTGLSVHGPTPTKAPVELHFCRVDDAGTDGPLVLVVMRPASEVVLGQAVAHSAEAQKRVANLETEAKARALFFSEAAHELNTPLTVLALQTQLLRGALGEIEPGHAHALDLISSNIHRLVLLSQDIVDLARADSGRIVVKPMPVALFQLAREETDNFQALAAQAGLTLSFTASGESAMVTGEGSRLRQVLGNLIGNAIKFTPTGGRVEVEVAAAKEGITVRVHDTGPGMTAPDQAKLFRPFVRVVAEGAPKKPGTGLGLYLCKRIVEAHGGQIGCESAGPGKGMTFWFSVPLPTKPTAMPGSAPAAALPAPDPARRPRPERPAHRRDERARHDDDMPHGRPWAGTRTTEAAHAHGRKTKRP